MLLPGVGGACANSSAQRAMTSISRVVNSLRRRRKPSRLNWASAAGARGVIFMRANSSATSMRNDHHLMQKLCGSPDSTHRTNPAELSLFRGHYARRLQSETGKNCAISIGYRKPTVICRQKVTTVGRQASRKPAVLPAKYLKY